MFSVQSFPAEGSSRIVIGYYGHRDLLEPPLPDTVASTVQGHDRRVHLPKCQLQPFANDRYGVAYRL
jgi:hypothetical protein